MRIWIIANPTAGGGRARRRAEGAALALRRAGCRVELRYTRARGHGLELAREALLAGVDRLAVCGGDGSIGEVLPALAGTPLPLGLLPFGTANDLARALGVPRALSGAVHCLLHGPVAPMDLGRIGARYFSTVAAFGFDAEISHAMRCGQVPLAGVPGYLLQVARHLRHYRPPRVALEGDFGRIEQEVFLVASANTRSYGGGMAIAPNADPGDGLLDICIAGALSPRQALTLLPRLFWGGHIHHPAVRLERTQWLEIHCDEERLAHADGEYAGTAPLSVRCAAAALQVVLPPP